MRRFILSLSLLIAGLTAAAGQGVNPITPPTNWLIQVLDPAFANPSNFYTTPTLLGGDLTNLTVTGGTLASGAQVFTLTAALPNLSGVQVGVSQTITSPAGSNAGLNIGFNSTYAAGYTGSSATRGFAISNSAAGTSNTLVPAAASNAPAGNIGIVGTANSATTGLNVGVVGGGLNGTVSVGLAGYAQTAKNSGTNIGVVGTAVNTGTTPVMVGGWFSLNQTTNPATSAALVADNGSQTTAIALFANNASTVASINQTGGITATLTSASGTSSVCNTAGTNSLLTLVASGTACGSSALRTKDAYHTESLNLVGLDDLRTDIPWAYRKDSDSYDGGKIHVGLFADDIEAMDPRCVVYDKNGELLNYYDRCVLTYLVADRKALKARIVALEEKIH